MTDLNYDTRPRRDGVTIPTLWVAIALSLLVHIAAMWHWLPRLEMLNLAQPVHDTLEVRLSPPAGPAAALPAPRSRPTPAAPATPPPRASASLQPPASQSASPAITSNTSPPPAPPPIVAPAPIRIPSGGDLASYIEAQRLARGNPAPAAQPVDAEKSRSNQVAYANLAQQPLAFGYDPSKSGGIFDPRRMGYYDAEFMFYGWNKDARRRTPQLIEVKKGDASDIRIAMVRKMIEIIRQFEQEDFEWSSYRLGRDITLSARARDNAGLEDFMMREFFDYQRPSR